VSKTPRWRSRTVEKEGAMAEKRVTIAMAVAALGLLISGVAFAYEAVEVKNGGIIAGKVAFSGRPPAPKVIQVDQHREVCGKTQEIYEVEVKDGGLKNAVVTIVGVKKGKKFDFPEAVLDQRGCVYTPHIVLAAPGKLTVLNSDPISHCVHTYPTKNDSVNTIMTKRKRKISITLTSPETIPVMCDEYGYMRAFIVVAQHPYYAVTDEAGTFQLRDVPPGTYTLEVWHEKLGKQQQQVTVEAGKTAAVELTYKP
jgi:hypothetical protein